MKPLQVTIAVPPFHFSQTIIFVCTRATQRNVVQRLAHILACNQCLNSLDVGYL